MNDIIYEFSVDSLEIKAMDTQAYRGKVILKIKNPDFTDDELTNIVDNNWNQIGNILLKDEASLRELLDN